MDLNIISSCVYGEAGNLIHLTDSGGGAGLPNLKPKLKQNGTMPDYGRGCNCQYHGHNKPYENASTAAFGCQGLEKANIFQAVYQMTVLVKALKEDVGLETMTEIRKIVLENFLKSEKLQDEVKTNNPRAFDKLVDQLFNKNVPDPSEISSHLEELAADMDAALSNIESADYFKNVKDSVFSRWNTTNEGIEVFLNSNVEVYLLAVAVKQSCKCADWITKVAVDLLGLMRIKVVRDEGDEAEEGVGDLPPIYMEGMFILAFTKTYFDRHFEFLSGKDPRFGNSYRR